MSVIKELESNLVTTAFYVHAKLHNYRYDNLQVCNCWLFIKQSVCIQPYQVTKLLLPRCVIYVPEITRGNNF